MAYLVPPANGSDFARLYLEENEKNAIYITEGTAVRNGDDTGLIIFAKVWAISAEYRAKDGATIEKYPYIFFEIHDKPWEKTDWKTKEKQTIQPNPTEVFFCNYLMGDGCYSKPDLLEGFKGHIAFADHSTLIEFLPDLPEEKQGLKLTEMLEVESVELSEEFKGKKKPAIASGGNKSGYRGASAQKEFEKLADRANFIAVFLDPESDGGIFGEKHKDSMALLYPVNEDGSFKQQHYRNYLALILGGSSVL